MNLLVHPSKQYCIHSHIPHPAYAPARLGQTSPHSLTFCEMKLQVFHIVVMGQLDACVGA